MFGIAMGLMMVSGAVGSSISGSLNARAQQQQIKNEVCQLAQQMDQYKKVMADESSILRAENAQSQNKIQNMALSITQLKESISVRHANFKKTYNTWVIFSSIFLIILVFVFATKKFILGATTELT